MVMVSLAAMSILLKKAKTPKKLVSDINNEFICNTSRTNLSGNDLYKGKYDPNIGGCDFYLTKCTQSDAAGFAVTPGITTKEFFEVRLIGGGAAGSTGKGGGSGEEKTVHYPSLIQPFNETNNAYYCNSPTCKTCGTDGVCNACQKGYKLVNDVCEINFKYRVILGKGGTSSSGKNGGQTSIQIIR